MKTPEEIKSMKGNAKITMLTAYDFPTACILESAGVDIILVGDSLGMVVLGYESTKQVTMQEMLHHTRAVARGSKKTMVVGDMPSKSYECKEDAVNNAKLFVEAGAHAIKIEGNRPDIISAVIDAGIPFMGHVGLTPQTAEKYSVQGKTPEDAEKLLNDAKELEALGCFCIVLECIPLSLAKKITESVSIPTIGIGAGKWCDGQVLVTHDMLGLFDKFTPKFVKKYANLSYMEKQAFERFISDVRKDKFPDEEHSYR